MEGVLKTGGRPKLRLMCFDVHCFSSASRTWPRIVSRSGRKLRTRKQRAWASHSTCCCCCCCCYFWWWCCCCRCCCRCCRCCWCCCCCCWGCCVNTMLLSSCCCCHCDASQSKVQRPAVRAHGAEQGKCLHKRASQSILNLSSTAAVSHCACSCQPSPAVSQRDNMPFVKPSVNHSLANLRQCRGISRLAENETETREAPHSKPMLRADSRIETLLVVQAGPNISFECGCVVASTGQHYRRAAATIYRLRNYAEGEVRFAWAPHVDIPERAHKCIHQLPICVMCSHVHTK